MLKVICTALVIAFLAMVGALLGAAAFVAVELVLAGGPI